MISVNHHPLQGSYYSIVIISLVKLFIGYNTLNLWVLRVYKN